MDLLIENFVHIILKHSVMNIHQVIIEPSRDSHATWQADNVQEELILFL